MKRRPEEKRKTINRRVGWTAVQCDVSEGEEVKPLWDSGSWECTETRMKQRSIHRGKPQRSEPVDSVLNIVTRVRKTESVCVLY